MTPRETLLVIIAIPALLVGLMAYGDREFNLGYKLGMEFHGQMLAHGCVPCERNKQ